jgi:hypothetical protein
MLLNGYESKIHPEDKYLWIVFSNNLEFLISRNTKKFLQSYSLI